MLFFFTFFSLSEIGLRAVVGLLSSLALLLLALRAVLILRLETLGLNYFYFLRVEVLCSSRMDLGE